MFMISDDICISTRRYVGGDTPLSDPLDIIINGHESLLTIKKGCMKEHGTVVTMRLKKGISWKELSQKKSMLEIIKKYIDKPAIPIAISSGDVSDKCEEKIEIFDGYEANINSLLGYYDKNWKDNVATEFVQTLDININESEAGIEGVAKIAYIHNDKMPVVEFKTDVTELTTNDGKTYDLYCYVNYSKNAIRMNYKNVSVNTRGKIKTNSAINYYFKSRSKISIKAMNLSIQLFQSVENENDDSWKLIFPFPVVTHIKQLKKKIKRINLSQSTSRFQQH